MSFLFVGVILGVITYVSYLGFYWLYLPKSIRHWFERSIARLFLLDLGLTVLGMIMFSSISATLTAVIAASVLGFLGTLTTIGIRLANRIRNIRTKSGGD